MARWLLIAALVLVALFGVSQLVIPPVAEHRIEDRLTDGGGTVAGYPTGPLAELITSTIAVRL